MTTTDRLVYMANQIARELASQRPDDAVTATWDHFRHFWDPRMRQAIVAYLDGGGEHLSDIASGAVALLRDFGPMQADNAVADTHADRAD